MAMTWVLVADSSRARIFSRNGRKPFMEEEGFIHPEGRLHEQELTSDLPGSASSNVGGERHGVGAAKVPPKRHEAITFAKQLAERLEKGRVEGSFSKLMIVAPPTFLGMLRESFGTPLREMVEGEIDKNLSQLTAHDLAAELDARI